MCKLPILLSDWLTFAATFMILFIPFYNSFYATFAVTLWGFIFRKTLAWSFGARGDYLGSRWALDHHTLCVLQRQPQGESRSVMPAVLDVSTSHWHLTAEEEDDFEFIVSHLDLMVVIKCSFTVIQEPADTRTADKKAQHGTLWGRWLVQCSSKGQMGIEWESV